MIKLYNTLTKQVDPFSPLKDRSVGLYTCGPTVYGTAHIGNLRTYLFEDILRRALVSEGYSVKHVMNITDVGHLTSDADTGDDKIERAARESHKDAKTITRQYEQEFFSDSSRMHILPPHVVLRATETIELQMALIKTLEMNGVTYRISDGIYFDTSAFPGYGRLSGQNITEKKAGARVMVNSDKKHPSDFALWKFSKPEDKRQMEWPSPWGVGFPGWHVECSAMSIKEFPNGLDLHCGGIDHIPVHHENELAQNEASGHRGLVKRWMHGEFLILPGKRMGKSEGNVITLADLDEKKIDPLAFRYLCLQTHYRQPLRFSWESLRAADRGLHNLWFMVDTNGDEKKIGCAEFEERFHTAINDDLNTAQALAILHELVKSDNPWSAKLQSLSKFDEILGLGLTKDAGRSHFMPIDHHTKILLDQRESLRQRKNWDAADEKRRKIEEHLALSGVILEDTPEGPRLRKKDQIDRFAGTS